MGSNNKETAKGPNRALEELLQCSKRGGGGGGGVLI